MSKCYPNYKFLISLKLFYSLLRECVVPFKGVRSLSLTSRLVCYQAVSEVSCNSYLLLPNSLLNYMVSFTE